MHKHFSFLIGSANGYKGYDQEKSNCAQKTKIVSLRNLVNGPYTPACWPKYSSFRILSLAMEKKKVKNSLTICTLLHSGWLVYSFISLLIQMTNSTVKITVKKRRAKADCRRRTLSPFHTHYDKTYSWKLFTLVTKQCLKKRNKIAWIIRTESVLSLGLGFPKLFGLLHLCFSPQ